MSEKIAIVTIITAIITAISGILVAVIGLANPFSKWSAERKKNQYEERKKILKNTISFVNSNKWSPNTLLGLPSWGALQPYIKKDIKISINSFKSKPDSRKQNVTLYSPIGHDKLKDEVLAELLRLSKKWKTFAVK